MCSSQPTFPMSKLFLLVVFTGAIGLTGCSFSSSSPTPAALLTPSPTLSPTETPTPTATPSPSPTATLQIPTPVWSPAGWHIRSSESFDVGDGWFVGTSPSEDQPYTVSIRDGKYIWSFLPAATSYGTGVVPGVSPNSLGDFIVTVEGQQTKGEEMCSYGFMLRNSSEGGYYFDIDERGGTFGFTLIFQGETFFYRPSGQLQKWQLFYESPRSSAIRSGSPNILGVVAEGPNFSLYINDELVGQVTDDRVSSGKIGLSLFCDGEAEVSFDNFAVFVP